MYGYSCSCSEKWRAHCYNVELLRMSPESLECELERQKELEDDATSKLRVLETHEKDKKIIMKNLLYLLPFHFMLVLIKMLKSII